MSIIPCALLQRFTFEFITNSMNLLSNVVIKKWVAVLQISLSYQLGHFKFLIFQLAI